jgi:hypothetical protein
MGGLIALAVNFSTPVVSSDVGPTSKYFCAHRPPSRGRATIQATDLTKFAGAPVFHVVLSLPASNDDARQSLVASVAEALSFWLGACPTCSGENGIALVEGNLVYLRMDVLSGIEHFSLQRSRPGIPRLGDQVGLDQVVGRGFLASEADKLRRYVLLRPDMTDVQRICGSARQSLTHMLQIIAPLLCNGTLADVLVKDIATVHIALVTDDQIGCGVPSETIACGRPDDFVNLNDSDFDFVMPNGAHLSQETKSKGRVDLELVLIHEVGHWLGLPHFPGGSKIMGTVYDDNLCLDDDELNRMKEAVKNGWDQRLTGPHAFVYSEGRKR